MRSLSAALLVFQAALLAGASPGEAEQLLVNQKWSWSDLDALKEQVKQGIHEQSNRLTEGIKSYRESAEDYAKALRDDAFRAAVQASGVCNHLPALEEESGPEIEEEVAEDLGDMEQDPSEDEKACEAVADDVTAQELASRLQQGETSGVVDRFMTLITDRSSAALCQGENGIKDWLRENASLRDTDPEKYKEQLKERLRGRMGPVLQRYSDMLCKDDDEEEDDDDDEDDTERLFAVGARPLASVRGLGLGKAAPAAAVFGLALLGLGVVAVRRSTRGPQPQELEPLALEEVSEGGLAV